MKKFLTTIFVISLMIGIWACRGAVIDHPGIIQEQKPQPKVLDFKYQESNTGSGYVRFTNLSEGYHSFEWDFGFTDPNGERVTSKKKHPVMLFPAKGKYLVTLKAIDMNSQKTEIYRQIEIVYLCC